MSSGIRKRVAITQGQRRALRAQKQANKGLNHSALQTWFEEKNAHRPSQSTIAESLSDKYRHLDLDEHEFSRAQVRGVTHPELEEALKIWVQENQRAVPLTDFILIEKAKVFFGRLYPGETKEPAFSNGWLWKFKRRHGIQLHVRHGEAGSVDLVATAKRIIECREACNGYAEDCIYNCDETALFWRMTPHRGLSTEQLSGTKQDKARITIHFCCNADGSDKMTPWLIGKSKNPRAFGQDHCHIRNLDVVYRHNTNAWMLTGIMTEWYQSFNRRMIEQGKKAILLLDNFSAHQKAYEELEDRQRSNFSAVFLPPNATSKHQPLDQGIINAWKAIYRRQFVRFLLAEHEAGRNPLRTVNLRHAVTWANMAWEEVRQETISNCWRKAACHTNPPTSLDLPLEQLSNVSEVVHEVVSSLSQHESGEAMSLSQFLNPVEEAVTGGILNIDEIVQTVQAAEGDSESADEESSEPQIIPRISIREVLQALHIVQTYEAQTEHPDADFRRAVNKRTCTLQGLQHQKKKQKSIVAYMQPS